MREIIINQPRVSYYVGGAEMLSMDHARFLCMKGYRVRIFTINPRLVGIRYSERYLKFKNEFKDKIEFIEIDLGVRHKNIYNTLPGEDRYRWNHESIVYSGIFSNIVNVLYIKAIVISYYILDAIGVNSDCITNCLYLCGTPQGVDAFQGSFLYSYDKIIAITNEVRSYWQQFTQVNIPVVTSGVDIERFSFYGDRGKITKFLYLGRIIKRKGIEDFLKLPCLLEDRTKNFQFEVVGDGPNLEIYKAEFGKNIKFIGCVDNPEKYLKNSDVVICFSEYGEGLQGVILEAMSTGCIVVATKTEINSNLLCNNCGILVDYNLNDLIKSLKRLLSMDNKSLKLMRMNARRLIESKYSWNVKIDEIIEAIE